jgi:hypothetical protein
MSSGWNVYNGSNWSLKTAYCLGLGAHYGRLTKIASQSKWTLGRALNAKNLGTNAKGPKFCVFFRVHLGFQNHLKPTPKNYLKF